MASRPERFVMLTLITSSAQVGWMPTVCNRWEYVAPHLQRHTEADVKPASEVCEQALLSTSGDKNFLKKKTENASKAARKNHEILQNSCIIRIYQTYFKLKAKPCITSPAFGPVKCRPRIFWSPSRSHTTCGSSIQVVRMMTSGWNF